MFSITIRDSCMNVEVWVLGVWCVCFNLPTNVTLMGCCFQGDFCNTIDALSRIAVHSRQPPDGSVSMHCWFYDRE